MSSMIFGKAFFQKAMLAVIAASLSGCFDDGSGGDAGAAADPNAVGQAPPATNQPPEVSGTPAATVIAGQAYSFTPDASDPDANDFLEFSITNKPEWAQFNTETGVLTGTPADSHVGDSEEIVITVTDGRDTRSIGPFTIRVNPRSQPPPSPTNRPPTIEGSAPSSVVVGETYRFQPTARDADGDVLRYSISNRPSWAQFSTADGTLTGTPTSGNVTTYSNIVISVNDGTATALLPRFSIQVRGPDNNAPSISGTPGTAVQAGQTYSFRVAANDPDGDNLTYSVTNRPRWATFSTLNGILSGTPAAADVGTFSNIRIRVSDGRVSATLPAFSIAVTAAPTPNRAPTISGTPATTATVGSIYTFAPSASDPDGGALGFGFQNCPGWASCDTATGRVSGTPSAAGTFSNIVVRVTDNGGLSASLPAFTIRVTAPNGRAPTISGTPATSVSAGAAYNFRPTATDADGDALTFSIQNPPGWASFETSTGRLFGTPGSANAGSYSNIVISVSDGRNRVSLPAFAITVSQSANGTAALSWTPPTQNTNGTALTNLAGYRVVYGRSSSNLDQIVQITNTSVSTHTVTGLASGRWYFAVKAYNTSSLESDVSNVRWKDIP